MTDVTARLNTIAARAKAHRDTYPQGLRNADLLAYEDVPYLLDLARKQQAALDAVRELAAKFEAKPEHRSVAARIREALEAKP